MYKNALFVIFFFSEINIVIINITSPKTGNSTKIIDQRSKTLYNLHTSRGGWF